MALPLNTERSWNGRQLRISAVTSDERDRAIREAIAARAFQLSESRGFESGHGPEDWRRAESEISRPLSCGCLMMDRCLELNADAGCFGEGTINIYVEPKRLTFVGKANICAVGATSHQTSTGEPSHLIIRKIDLPGEIEPSNVSASFRGRMIRMELPKACRKPMLAAVI